MATPADVQAGEVERQSRALLVLPLRLIAAQFLDFEAAAITQNPTAGFFQAHEQGFVRVGSRFLLRRDLDLVEDSQVVEAPLGFEHRALTDRFAVVNQQFAIHQAQAYVFVSQNHDVLNAILCSGDDLEFQIHLMGGFRRRGAPACRGMRVSVVSQIIQDAVAVGARAIQRIGLRRFAHERRPELAFRRRHRSPSG